MTQPIYTQQALRRYNLPRLKTIAAELGITPTLDKRGAETWIKAIISHQSAQSQKATGEQAQPTANVPLTPIVCSFYDHEYYAGDKLIAAITYDHDLTQPWVVMVNNKEVHRASTVMLCHRYISTHYKDGSLPVQEQNATHTPCTTGNEIMAQIFNECEKYGFALLDDGIYHNDVKLGEVGCTDGNWWVKRGSSDQQYCNSVMDAVRRLCPSQTSLSIVDTLPHAELAGYEELLDRPFEMLTAQDWQLLREYEPALELVAA